MWALNLKRSPENGEFWGRADPFSMGAGETGGALTTSAVRTSGVSDSIELHNGKHSTRRAIIKALGEMRKASTRVWPPMLKEAVQMYRWPRRE